MVLRKTFFSNQVLTNGESTFNVEITNVNFQPDEIIFKVYTWQDNTSTTASQLLQVSSDLTSWQPFMAFNNGAALSSSSGQIYTSFPLNRSINGVYGFKIDYFTGGNNQFAACITIQGTLSIQFEFVKY